MAFDLLPSAVIELDPSAPLNALLGPLPTHPVGTPYAEPAIRAIVFTDIRGSVAQTMELGDAGHMAVLRAPERHRPAPQFSSQHDSAGPRRQVTSRRRWL